MSIQWRYCLPAQINNINGLRRNRMCLKIHIFQIMKPCRFWGSYFEIIVWSVTVADGEMRVVLWILLNRVEQYINVCKQQNNPSDLTFQLCVLWFLIISVGKFSFVLNYKWVSPNTDWDPWAASPHHHQKARNSPVLGYLVTVWSIILEQLGR